MIKTFHMLKMYLVVYLQILIYLNMLKIYPILHLYIPLYYELMQLQMENSSLYNYMLLSLKEIQKKQLKLNLT